MVNDEFVTLGELKRRRGKTGRFKSFVRRGVRRAGGGVRRVAVAEKRAFRGQARAVGRGAKAVGRAERRALPRQIRAVRKGGRFVQKQIAGKPKRKKARRKRS